MRMFSISTRWFLVTTVVLSGLFFFNTALAQDNSTLSEAEQTRVTNLAANISNKMEATVKRLVNISLRMQARNAQSEAPEVVIQEVDRQLRRINPLINEVEGITQAMDGRIDEMVHSENPAERWRNIRTLYLSGKNNLREAHIIMVGAYNLLEDPSSFTATEPAGERSTSTASTTEAVASSTNADST